MQLVHFKTVLRNIKKHKGFAFINMTGLGLGMACTILILLYVNSEFSYDRYHADSARIYRLCLDANLGGQAIQMPISNAPAAPALIRENPEVLDAVRFRKMPRASVKFEEREFFEDDIFFADASVFDVFSFRMTQGDPGTALIPAYSVVLTRRSAVKYFGDEDPVGKVLTFNGKQDYSVRGVVDNVPWNSHFNFDMLVSFETLYARDRKNMEEWFNFNLYSYLLLSEPNAAERLEEKMPAFVDRHMGQTLKALGGIMTFFLQPLTAIHLHSDMENEIRGNGSITFIYIFVAIAVFILIIACINFMNLATARSASRAKEVGVRKVVGASKRQLMGQFFGECLLFSVLSLGLALILVAGSLPLFRTFAGRPLELVAGDLPWLAAGLFCLVLFVGAAAGSYPALFLSGFQPSSVLKGNLRTGAAHSLFRSILVTLQFAISIILIIGTIIIFRQLGFMRSKNLGFEKRDIIVVSLREKNLRDAIETLKQELGRIPGVSSITASSNVPGRQINVNPYLPEGFSQDQTQLMESLDADSAFVNTLGMEIVAGRNFSNEFGTDKNEAVIINETAARRFGWEEPIGKKIEYFSGESVGDRRAKTVVGMVRDIHLGSLHRTVMPLYLTNEDDDLDTLSVKLSGLETGSILDRLKETWAKVTSGSPFDYEFLDDTFDRQYRGEERLSRIFAAFALLAAFIACLGLFGMASFMAEKRAREIGIRKVLGATSGGVVILLSKDFLKLVGTANLFAWPIAYLSMSRWLQAFAYRTGFEPWIFPLTGCISLGIAQVTVTYQSLKAALADPARAIKYE